MKTKMKIAVIGHWPTLSGVKTGKDFTAIAWHGKNTLPLLKNHFEIDLHVPSLQDSYMKAPKGINIKSSFQKSGFWSICRTFWQIARSPLYQKILIQYELNIFGGNRGNLAFLIGLVLAKVYQKETIVELHQVISDFSSLANHIGVKNALMIRIFTILLRLYYILITKLSTNIVIFEEKLLDYLLQFCKKSKITTLSLPPPHLGKISPNSKKSSLEYRVLMFGYFNWYKGTDLIANAFAKSAVQYPKLKLIMAGGANPYHTHKKFYQEYFSQIENICEQSESIQNLGFVPESELKNLFAKVDLVVLPYRRFFAGSGPFAHALATFKPVILSEKLMGYMASSDFRDQMFQSDLSPEDLFFTLDCKKILQHIEKIRQNKKVQQKLADFSKSLYLQRQKSYQIGMQTILKNNLQIEKVSSTAIRFLPSFK